MIFLRLPFLLILISGASALSYAEGVEVYCSESPEHVEKNSKSSYDELTFSRWYGWFFHRSGLTGEDIQIFKRIISGKEEVTHEIYSSFGREVLDVYKEFENRYPEMVFIYGFESQLLSRFTFLEGGGLVDEDKYKMIEVLYNQRKSINFTQNEIEYFVWTGGQPDKEKVEGISFDKFRGIFAKVDPIYKDILTPEQYVVYVGYLDNYKATYKLLELMAD
ncbi:hypothetical protein QSV34_03200 [Porticoccus sp. W117]|uniref:hypothetical protein n=1 Tax=Porticoccus sp. W117 TaxID=3054777 RepID=UPI0025921CB4|nr:hypothetical protein [Porticoccus sp. W117]MDM3870356.1 hypothetical protein [Porticoccus sp. W117]